MINFFNAIEPIFYYVAITFMLALLCLNYKKQKHIILISILFINIATEITALVLSHKIGLVYSISMIINGVLWLFYLLEIIMYKNIIIAIITFFLLFGLINLFFFEGTVNCNFNTFIIGSFLYIIIFIFKSFYELKKENFSFLSSNDYFLACSPILFFFGLTFMFGFKSKELAETTILGHFKLYDLINSFVNIVYYSLINIYIYREKKLKNA